MKILICYGTRPEWIKIKPLVEKLKAQDEIKYEVLFVEQHKDIVTGVYDKTLKVNDDLTHNRLDSIFSSILISDCDLREYTHVLVQGDTAAACAMALKAFHHKIPVIHLEAGLRTYDVENPYPEESYRQIISSVASIHLCPMASSKINLKTERKNGVVEVVGNTVLDNLINIKPRLGNNVVVTMHRRENHKLMAKWFEAINKIAKKSKYNFILPIHPNPNVQKHKGLLTNVFVIEPLGYKQMIKLVSEARGIITDSGGLQEEGCFLNKRVIVCRRTTERLVHGNPIFSTNDCALAILCRKPSELEKTFFDCIEHDDFMLPEKINEGCPYGQGNSSDIIMEVLRKLNK